MLRLTRSPAATGLLVSALLVAGCQDAPRAHRHGGHSPDDPTLEPDSADRTPDDAYPTESYGRSGYGGLQPAENGAVRQGHPRLFLSGPGAFPDGDEQTRTWRTLLRQRADDLIGKPLIDDAPRKLLTRSREAVRRISLLAGVYQFTRDPKYADAGRRELLNVCHFEAWQPDDFLATAEMMTAVSIGYDWLFDTLPPEDRRTVVDALVNLGLRPALQQYASHGGWTTAHHNWNMVCNGGVIVASLAVAEEQPALSRRTLNTALTSLRNGLQAYDAQGGTAEGPMYHNYATRYLTYAAAALESACLKPVLIEAINRNWTAAGDYRIETTGPTDKIDPTTHESEGKKSCNFGDSDEVVGNSAWMFWHARHFSRPEYAAYETAVDQTAPSAFDLLWYAPAGRPPTPPLTAKFGSVVTMRTAFDDPQATYVAVRCGSTAENHTHLDLGTFVLDMLGQRFAADLGADNYDLPGYLGKRRPDYLRSSTPGHNTLSIGDTSQPLDSVAPGKLLRPGPGGATAEVDLTNAYPGSRSATRDVTLSPGGTVTVADQMQLSFPGPVVWHLHTPARVTPTRDGALLLLNGREVELHILEPAGARLSVDPDVTDPPARPVEGITHVRIKAGPARESRFVIEFRPVVR